MQCSNCGHTWFQRHPDDDPELAEDLDEALPDPEWEPEPEPLEEEERPPLRRSRPEVVVSNPPKSARPPEDVPPPPPPPQQSQARSLDPSVAEVLRQEAELERSRRQAEGLESQPDLGLGEPDEDEQARRSREARARMAQMRGQDLDDEDDIGDEMAVAAAGAAAAAGSRRDLLPDVEEINQTLRSSAEPRREKAPRADLDETLERPVRKKSGGFGRGFMLILLLAAVAVGVYLYAPQISEAVPAAAPILETYIAQVDAGRVWLDGQVTALLETLDSMSSESGGTEVPSGDGS